MRKFIEIVENADLAAWFGGSQVTNPDGSPKIVFHGTTHEIKGPMKSNFCIPERPLFFTDSLKAAQEYSRYHKQGYDSKSSIVAAYLRVTNPKIVSLYDDEHDGGIWEEIGDAYDEGHDGLIALDTFAGKGSEHDQCMWFGHQTKFASSIKTPPRATDRK